MIAFKQPNSLRNLLVRAEISKPNTTMGKSHSCGDKRCKRNCIPVRSPENSTQYFVLLIARVQMLFTFLSVLFVASNTLADLSSTSTNPWMDTGVILQKNISSCEPALQTVWPQSRGFQQNENPHHWTERYVEWFSTCETGKILDKITPCFISGRY
jgi:hypothetical protein